MRGTADQRILCRCQLSMGDGNTISGGVCIYLGRDKDTNIDPDLSNCDMSHVTSASRHFLELPIHSVLRDPDFRAKLQ